MLKKITKSILIITIILILSLSGNIMIALATTQSDLDKITATRAAAMEAPLVALQRELEEQPAQFRCAVERARVVCEFLEVACFHGCKVHRLESLSLGGLLRPLAGTRYSPCPEPDSPEPPTSPPLKLSDGP